MKGEKKISSWEERANRKYYFSISVKEMIELINILPAGNLKKKFQEALLVIDVETLRKDSEKRDELTDAFVDT